MNKTAWNLVSSVIWLIMKALMFYCWPIVKTATKGTQAAGGCSDFVVVSFGACCKVVLGST